MSTSNIPTTFNDILFVGRNVMFVSQMSLEFIGVWVMADIKYSLLQKTSLTLEVLEKR